MQDALLLVDVMNAFDHEDGEQLLASFRPRHGGFVRALEDTRVVGVRLERAAA
jgi:hypothetical protein